jgi:hypothetical protein
MPQFRLWDRVIVNTGGDDAPGIVMDDRPPRHLRGCVLVAFENGTKQWMPTGTLRHSEADPKS